MTSLTLFRERGLTLDTDFLPTDEIQNALNADKEAPWADWRNGQGISAEKLAKTLKPFGVRSFHNQKLQGRPHGYLFGKLRPVFERYLSTP